MAALEDHAFARRPRAAQANVPSEVRALGRSVVRALGLASSIVELVTRSRAEDAAAAPTPEWLAGRSQRAAEAILERHGVIVVANAPSSPGPAIIVTNHTSYLDPLVVASVLPCLAIAKGETGRWPLVGPGLRALGVLFVRRGDPHSGAIVLRRALRALRAGASVLNFAEGTTTDGQRVGPFHRGIFGLARLASVPVIPAWIAYDDPRVAWFGGAAFAPHYARLAQTRHVVARVRFGAPFAARSTDDATYLAARARADVAALKPR
ncbi:MAG TPA: lysophospholipid acyltransferase family protein [Polyangiaceae bacterium]|jgi:1-acyl-sn-glycerol-3-phosphate acyltransferase|nr:lysophospholipid acyltransferase family protein [Polyangiaceae bacterium]